MSIRVLIAFSLPVLAACGATPMPARNSTGNQSVLPGSAPGELRLMRKGTSDALDSTAPRTFITTAVRS